MHAEGRDYARRPAGRAIRNQHRRRWPCLTPRYKVLCRVASRNAAFVLSAVPGSDSGLPGGRIHLGEAMGWPRRVCDHGIWRWLDVPPPARLQCQRTFASFQFFPA